MSDLAFLVALAALVVAFAALATGRPSAASPAPASYGRPFRSGKLLTSRHADAATAAIVPGGCTVIVGATASCWLSIDEPARKDGTSLLVAGGHAPIPIRVGEAGTFHSLHVASGKDQAALYWTAFEA